MKTIKTLRTKDGTKQVMVSTYNNKYVVHTYRLADDVKEVLASFDFTGHASIVPSYASAMKMAFAFARGVLS